jgi:hypothetical protein
MQTLEATTNVETKEVRVDRDGRITVWPNMAPIVNVQSVGYRLAPNVDFAMIPLMYVQQFARRFTVWNINTNTLSPALMLQGQGFRYYSPYQMARLRDMPISLQYTYTNGYFNSTVSGGVIAGAQTITFRNATGLSVGSTFNIYDGADTEEYLTVQSISTVNPNQVTLASPLLFNHADGISASSLPESVKAATILIASYLIKERGSVAVVMAETALQGAATRYNDNRDLEMAKEMLQPLIRAVTSDD